MLLFIRLHSVLCRVSLRYRKMNYYDKSLCYIRLQTFSSLCLAVSHVCLSLTQLISQLVNAA